MTTTAITWGFTGSRRGLTELQKASLRKWMLNNPTWPWMVFHGCCKGADEAFVDLVWEKSNFQGDPASPIRIWGYPCDITAWVSPNALSRCTSTMRPMAPLVRNGIIAGQSSVLLACPGGMQEEQRSGTWSTVRAARKRPIPVVIFWPDGSVTCEGVAGASG